MGSIGEEVGVIAALLQVHHHVEQRGLIATAPRVQCFKVACQHILVVLPGSQEIQILVTVQAKGKYKRNDGSTPHHLSTSKIKFTIHIIKRGLPQREVAVGQMYAQFGSI